MDLLARVGSTRLVMEHRSAADAASVDAAIEQLTGKAKKGDVPVVVVPFMGDVGKKLCRQSDVSWLDLSGNAGTRHGSSEFQSGTGLARCVGPSSNLPAPVATDNAEARRHCLKDVAR